MYANRNIKCAIAAQMVIQGSVWPLKLAITASSAAGAWIVKASKLFSCAQLALLPQVG